MKRYDSTCNVCGGHNLHPFAQRSDGVWVVMCKACGHGVVERFTDDIQALYGDQYFASQGDDIGYAEYAYTAEHGLAWAAALVRLLRPSGSVVDIGCANGRLLTLLGGAYDRFGIEPNATMSEEARRTGSTILARDLLDHKSLRAHSGRFDVALAIAVLEHVPDFRGAFEAALNLLRPNGLLLFEVPLIRMTNDIWFRSSLEHLHYPTERSLHYLFDNVLGLRLTGAVVEVEDYGCIYVGLTSPSLDVSQEAGTHFERLITAPPSELTHKETRFRWLFDLIHAAKASAETLGIPPPLDQETVNPLILRRIIQLWASRERRFENFRRQLSEVEKARDWHLVESQKRDEAIAEQQQQLVETQRYAAKLKEDLDKVEKARDWHAAESQKRDEAIVEQQQQLAETRRYVNELRGDLEKVEKARDWHASESQKRDETIADQQQQLVETRHYVARLKGNVQGVDKAREGHSTEWRKQDEAFAALQRQLVETRCYVAKLKQDLQEAEDAQSRCAAELQSRDEALADKHRQLVEANNLAARLEEGLHKAREAQDWHAAESRKQDKSLTEYQQQLVETRLCIATLKEDLHEVERNRDWHAAESRKRAEALTEQGHRLALAQQQFEILDQTITEQEKRVRDLRIELNGTEARLQASTVALQVKEERICDLQNSWSWRITRPLRLIIDALGK